MRTDISLSLESFLLKEIYPAIPDCQDNCTVHSIQMIGHVLILIESYKLYASGIPKTMARFSVFLEEIGLRSHYTQGLL